MKLKLLVILILFVLNTNIYAQKRIEVLNANTVEFSQDLGSDIKRLIGNVQFRHEDALMFCDSAYVNQKNNSLQAFSNVRIEQNDSLNLYGDYLSYDGNRKFARVRRNVRLVHGASTLNTDSLNFDRKTNIGHYFSWGYVHDKDNDLESLQGYYYSNYKDYYAVDSVKLTNPKYTIYSDSLRYNTQSDISYFYGATEIISDSNFIYCEYGKYDTKNDFAEVSQNAYIINKDKKLSGDAIYYDRKQGFGEAKNNVCVQDTSMKMDIFGHYACLFEKRDSVYITQKAILSKYGNTDTLYLHADTLLLFTVYDTLSTKIDTAKKIRKNVLTETYQNHFLDSMIYDGAKRLLLTKWELEAQKFTEDSIKNIEKPNLVVLDTIRNVIAFHHAQIFAKDIQARSDSIAYSTRDSITKLFTLPILWSQEKQITADYIELLTEDNKPKEVYLQNAAFIILQDDSVRFNQVSGKNMRGYFNENQELHQLNVLTNALSVFFVREEDSQMQPNKKGDLVGVNHTEGSEMIIYFKENKPDIISVKRNAKGVLNPVEYKPIEETKLKGFSWKDAIRPKTQNDIFIWKTLEDNLETY